MKITELFLTSSPATNPSMYQAPNGLTPQAGGRTLAEGIAVKTIGTMTLPIVERLVSDVLLVNESDLERGVQLLLGIEKTVAEGAGAATLAALLAHPERFAGRRVGAILTGGNIDMRLLSSVILRGLVRDRCRAQPSSPTHAAYVPCSRSSLQST